MKKHARGTPEARLPPILWERFMPVSILYYQSRRVSLMTDSLGRVF